MPGWGAVHAALAGDGRRALEARREGAALVVQVQRTVEHLGGSAQDVRSGGRNRAHVVMVEAHAAVHSMHLACRLYGLAFLGNGYLLWEFKLIKYINRVD